MKQKNLLVSAAIALFGMSGAMAQDGSSDTKEITITDPLQTSYDLGGETNYKYLVIVPSNPYVENKSNQFLYNLTDGTNTIQDWGFAYGFYQQRRVTVLNLSNKVVYQNNTENTTTDASGNKKDVVKDFSSSNIDMTKLTTLKIVAENPANDGTLAISAIYFTNNKPTYENRWNFPVDCLGTPGYDYIREAETAGTWGTICLPYAAAICGAYVYEVAGVDNAENPTEVYVKQVYGLLEAGKAYLFKSNTDKASDFKEGVVTFYRAGAAESEAKTGDIMVGSYTDDTKVPVGCYIINTKGQFRKCIEGRTNYINSNRAYIDLSKASAISSTEASSAKYIKFSIDGGETTGINSMNIEQNGSDVIYNLNGMRVNNPSKGIYLKNGKKFVVK